MRHNIAQEVDNRDCDSSSMESGSPKKRTTVRKSNPKLDFSSDSDTPHRKLRPRRNEKLSEAVIQKPGDVGNDNRHGSDFDSKLKVIIEPEDFVSTDFGKSNKMHSDENVVILKRMMDHIVSIMSDDEHKPQLEKMYGESEILEVKNLIKSGGNDREKVYQILKPSTLKIYKNLNQPEHIGLFKGCDIFSLKSSPSHNEKVNQIVAELLQSCSPDNKQSTSENVKKDKFIKRLFTTNNQTKEISESETKILDNETGISENGNKTRSTNKNRRHKLTNRRKKAKKIMKGQLQAESSPMIQEPDVLELTELTNNNKNDVLKENIDHTFEKEENFLPQNFSIASPKFYLTQNKKGIHKLIGRKDFVQEVIGNVVICGETEIEGSNRIVLSNDDIELDHQTEKKAFNSSNANKDFVNDSSSSDIELKKEISLATSKELVRRNVEVIEISDDSSNSDKDLVKHNNLNVESHEILSPQGSPLCEDGINKLTDQIKLSGSKENCFSELDSSRKVSNTSAETNLRNSPKNCIKTNKKLKVEDSSESSCSSNSGSDDESAKEDIQNPNLEIITQKDLECNEALQMHTSDQLKQSIEEDNSIKLTTKYNNTIEQSIHKDQKLPKHSAKDPELLKECSPFMDRFKEKKSNKSNAEVQLNKRKKEIKRHKVTERNHNKLLNEKQEMAEHKLKHDNEAPKKDKKKERKKRGRTNMNQNESTKTSKKPLEMANTTKNNSSISEPHISRKRTSKKLSKDNTDLDETMELLSKPNTSSRASPLIKKECEKQMKQKTLLKTVITKQEDEEVATRLPGYETDSSENEPTFNNGEVNLNKTSPNHCYEIKFNSDNFEPNQNDYIALEYDIGNNSDSSYEKMIKEINSAKLEKINNGSKENVACLNEESNEATFETSVGSKINGSDKFTKGQKELDHLDPEMVPTLIVGKEDDDDDDDDDDILDLLTPNLDNMFNQNETNTKNPLNSQEYSSLTMFQEGSKERNQILTSPFETNLNSNSSLLHCKLNSAFNDFHPLPFNNSVVKSQRYSHDNSCPLVNYKSNSNLQTPEKKMLRRENLRREKITGTELIDHCKKRFRYDNTVTKCIEIQESNCMTSDSNFKKEVVKSPKVHFLPNFPDYKNKDNSDFDFSLCSTSPSISSSQEDIYRNMYCDKDSYHYDCCLEVEKEDTSVFTNNEILVKTAYVNNEPIGIMCPIDEGSFFSYKDKYQIRYTPELFVRKMKIKVRQQMELLKKPFMDNVVKNFMNKICEEYYKNGNCCSPLCVKKHLLPKEWYNMMADEEAWAITNLILTQAAQPPVSFCCSVLEWLGEVKKCKMKIMLVTEYFRRIKTFENCRTVWLAVLKALTISGFHEWEAVCCVLLYFYTDTCPSVTRNIMRYIGLEKRVYPNMWQSLQPLVEIGFQLPNTIIRSLLELLCHDKNNNFSNDAILLIGLQVKKMKPMNLQRMDTLIQKFLEIHKQIFPVKMPLKSCLKEANKPREEHNLSRKRSQTFSTEDHPLLKKPLILNTANSTSPNIRGVYEVEKVKAALLRSFKAKNTPDIANILFKYGGKKEYEVILAEELFTLIQPEKNAFQLIKDIIHEIRISGNMKHSILIMARVCITFMLHFVINFSDWKLAFDFLLLIRENHLNPIIMKPVCYEYSELRIAITCSEINFYNKHYNSAIAILINNKLLYEDSSKWQISGSSREFHFVKQIIQFLFINFNSAKMVDVSYTLFKSTMKSQNSLRVPIDLLDFYEPLLCNMFEKFDKYKHKLLSFYIQVNEIDSTVQLTGLSYRVLVIVAVRNDNFEVIKDLVSKAISTYVYPILEDKENVITLNTCLLQEEMKAYLVEWFRWDLNKSKDRSFLKHNVQIQFKLSKTDDFIECEQLPVPMILNSVDPSLNCAVRRLQAVLSEFTKVPFQALNIKMKNDALYVPPETTKLLIKSAKKMY
ncbi:MATH and LRR domain-containing protein PFE0570w-like isoform X1 [Cimex lectularius]|uniref:Uncharacterized protein n=1 Tax=Cimex lectularius TaxID=79782 RepID=A0A8I6TE42_CIMLE|nr:MATH and LRR domain-containing protein PFE0570w-like isoform X1 [Cimex lectularius]XP_014248583.1 MATH and LRR domain-containing protein PFE0570w-like isoform X1 [Cimex lectularius]